MISEMQPPRRTTPDVSGPTTLHQSYIDWAAIFAGTILALAISFLLISFGGSLGLSLTSPYRGEGVSARWVAIAAGIWFAWVMVTGFGAGGYLAGRMRPKAGDATSVEVEMRDGTHGLMVWATGALISMVIAASGIGGLLGAGGSVIDTATDAASETLSSDYFANVMLRNTSQTNGTTGDTAPSPMADGDAPSAPNRQQSAASTLQSVNAEAQSQIAAILVRSAANGQMQDRDRDYLAQLVAANSDLDTEAARARVDDVNAEIASARQATLDAVDQARVAGVVFGFIAAATLLIGALAAFFAAVAGGKHRDDGLGWDAFSTPR